MPLNKSSEQPSGLILAGLMILISPVWALAAPGDGRPVEGTISVGLVGDTLSIKARNAGLRDILAEIARRSRLVVVLHEPLDDQVSVDLHGVSLPTAIRRLLREHNFTLKYLPPLRYRADREQQDPSRLWVLADSPGAYEEILGHEPSADSKRSDALTAARAETIYALIAEGSDAVLEVLPGALLDSERRVREAAIDAYADLGGEESARALAVALGDQDAQLRVLTVFSLGEIGGQTSMGLLRQALGDEELTVREAAADVIAHLERSRTAEPEL